MAVGVSSVEAPKRFGTDKSMGGPCGSAPPPLQRVLKPINTCRAFSRRAWNKRSDVLFHAVVVEYMYGLPAGVLGRVFRFARPVPDAQGDDFCVRATIL